MNHSTYNTHASKQTLLLTINSNLLKQAKYYQINVAQTLEQALVEKVAKKQQEKWLQKNKKALESYNQRIEERGVFN